MTQPIPTEAELPRDLPVPEEVRAARLRAETREAHLAARDARLARERAATRTSVADAIADARAAVEARDAEIAKKLADAMPPDERAVYLAKRRKVAEAARALFRAAQNPDAMAGHLLELIDGVRVALLP